MLAAQDKLENALSAEVERLTALVAKQQRIISEWKPIVIDYMINRDSSIGTMAHSSVGFMDEKELGQAGLGGARSGSEVIPGQKVRFRSGPNTPNKMCKGVEWMHISSPFSPAESALRDISPHHDPDVGRAADWPMHSSRDSPGRLAPLTPAADSTRSKRFSRDELKGSLSKSECDLDSISDSYRRNQQEEASNPNAASSFIRTPFREILSLFEVHALDSDDSEPSPAGLREACSGARAAAELNEFDRIQADLMDEVNKILTMSPNLSRSGVASVGRQ